MSHTAYMMLPLYYVHDLARGHVHKYGLPADFLERVKDHSGMVSLGCGWWAITNALDGSSNLTMSTESDVLFLDDETETEVIEHLKRELAEMTANPVGALGMADTQRTNREALGDAVRALEAMRDTRLALGMDGTTWELS